MFNRPLNCLFQFEFRILVSYICQYCNAAPFPRSWFQMAPKIFFPHATLLTKSDTAAPKTLTSVFHGFLLFFQNPAPTEACAQLKKPPYEEDCRIPCPEECVLSAWTDWSSCPSNCLNSRINRRLPLSFRNRTLLALSSTAASGQNLGKEA